jgi:hypothetical protein
VLYIYEVDSPPQGKAAALGALENKIRDLRPWHTKISEIAICLLLSGLKDNQNIRAKLNKTTQHGALSTFGRFRNSQDGKCS